MALRRLLVAAEADGEHPEYKWVGLGIVIGSAVLSNLGVNVQKLSHVRVRLPLSAAMLLPSALARR